MADSGLFSVISQLFLTISQLFLTSFWKTSHFLTAISGLFLTSQLLSYFSTISHLYFSTISQLLLNYYSSLCEEPFLTLRITYLSLFAQRCVLNEGNETIRDYFRTEVVVTSFYQLW